MTEEELRRLIAQGEGHHIEFKSSFKTDTVEAFGAFLNADGGSVLVGVRDDGTIVGLPVGRKTEEDIAAKVEQMTDPTAYPTLLQVIPINGKSVAVLQAHSRRVGTVYLIDHRAYVRVGSTTRYLSESEIKARHLEGAGLQRFLPDDWSREENAPQFDVRPHASNGMGKGPNGVAATITMSGADVRPRFRWVGDGIDEEWITLMRENRPHKFTGKPVPFDPPEDVGKVGFEVEFIWRDSECHALWEFPYHTMEKPGYKSISIDAAGRELQPIRYWRVPLT